VTTNAPSSPCSSFRRKPESSSFLLQSYPRKRDHRRWGGSTSLLLTAQVQGFHSPCGRAGNFLCLCKESNQRNTPPVARSPGILPSECANAFRGSLSAHPCARSELARILRAPLRAFPPRVRRATGGPVWAASCRRSKSNSSGSHFLLLRQYSGGANDCIDAVQGCTDSWMNGAVRGAEHRRGRRKKPEGARAGCARVGCQHMDVLSADPVVPEKHRAVRFARCESDRRVRCLAFLVTFWAMPKSNRLAEGETKLCTSRAKNGAWINMDSRLRGNDVKRRRRWIPAFAGMTSNRETVNRRTSKEMASTRASARGAP